MKVSVIGLGYVGSVAAAGFAAAGHDVLGIDIDMARVESYRRGEIPFYEPALCELINSQRRQNLRFMHVDEIMEPLGDVIVIATGTPPTETGCADLSYVNSALQWIKEQQQEGGVIVMKSTVPPGTGVRLQATILRDTNFEYVSNPEFLREGQAVNDWFYPDRIVIGSDSGSVTEIVKSLYNGIEAPFAECDITSAEMIKYAANAFLATKISFINEIAALSDKVGATIDDVVDGIALDPRIGSSAMKAGVGYGGSCFPKDVRALDNLALTNGYSFELLRSVIAVNNRQRHLPLYALRDRFGALTNITVGVLGLAFKPQTDDIRESPAMELINVLTQEGVNVKAYDPLATPVAKQHLPAEVELYDDLLNCVVDTQALLLMTEWPQIVEADWNEIAQLTSSPRLLFDGRNALDAAKMRDLGFEYIGVGRGGTHMARNSGTFQRERATAAH